jgi:hypothetical protein
MGRPQAKQRRLNRDLRATLPINELKGKPCSQVHYEVGEIFIGVNQAFSFHDDINQKIDLLFCLMSSITEDKTKWKCLLELLLRVDLLLLRS